MKSSQLASSTVKIECWSFIELSLEGPSDGNPFKEVHLQAQFQHKQRVIDVDGFYDGNGVYKIRFMPDTEGEWTYSVSSNIAVLNGSSGGFVCTSASVENHGPVHVRDADRFAYADGTTYRPYGTTCYVWTHQEETLQEQTLQSLSHSPFNKIRMCVFPKHYSFNTNEPEDFPFVGSKADGFDWNRFNPLYFARLEQRIGELQRLGIEADLILFHPYDNGQWGFDRMNAETDEFYLRYVIARLSAFRNIWWSLANEFDFMKEKKLDDWDRFFRIVQESDPYRHLRSIHNGTKMYDPTHLTIYDHTKPWVTHVSMQYWELSPTTAWRKLYRKPIVVDECCYEGNLPQRWGNITGEDMTARMWDGFMRGGYVGHGETFLHPDEIVWWSKGGQLYGDSPARIAFLRQIFDASPEGITPIETFRDAPTLGIEGEYYLQYFGVHRPAYRELPLPEESCFQIEVLDTWNMTITALNGVYSGLTRVNMPATPYIALRAYRVERVEN